MKTPNKLKPAFSFLAEHQRKFGLAGIILFVIWFILYPSWPTPDRIFILLAFSFMSVGATWDGFKKFTPFVALLLVYESFRGVADDWNSRVEYTWMIDMDEKLFGGRLPTLRLQDWLFTGSATWFEIGLYMVYMLHFVLPFLLAFLIWRYKSDRLYWRYALSILITSFAGFITFALFPAAPPWLASNEGYIQGFEHVTNSVWEYIGLADIPSIYAKISPNPVAAVPSLHAAYATLLALFTFLAFGKKWGSFALIYPILIYFGTVYLGEHYLIDEIIGSLYALFGYVVSGFILNRVYKKSAEKKTIKKAKE